MTFLSNIIEGKVPFYVTFRILIILSATFCGLSLGTMCLTGARKWDRVHIASARTTKIYRPVSSLLNRQLTDFRLSEASADFYNHRLWSDFPRPLLVMGKSVL